MLQNIKAAAEDLFLNYDSANYTCHNYIYYNGKKVKLYKQRSNLVFPDNMEENSTYEGPNMTYYLPLYDDWAKLYQVPVSLNSSAIHVPTNIYECGMYTLLQH